MFTSTTWIIISWVFVALFTGLNVFIFLKLKKASEQMLKMAMPGTKNLNEAVQQMQAMFAGKGGNQTAMLQNAMQMLKQMQNQKGFGPKPRV